VSSLSKTLEEKMERLRASESPSPSPPEMKSSRKAEMNGKEGRWGKGLILGKRRNSLIENGRKGSSDYEEPKINGIEQGNRSQNVSVSNTVLNHLQAAQRLFF